jgi:hypothetical protein
MGTAKKSRRTARRTTVSQPRFDSAALRRIWEAGAAGNLDTALIRQRHFDPNLIVDGVPLLLVAAEGGHDKVVDMLLAHPRIDPNLALENGATPLLLAAQNGYAAVVRTLLRHVRTDPNRATLIEGVTPLFIAAQNGHLDVVEALLADARTDAAQAVEGVDPVTMAAACGFEEIAQRILAHVQTDALPVIPPTMH